MNRIKLRAKISRLFFGSRSLVAKGLALLLVAFAVLSGPVACRMYDAARFACLLARTCAMPADEPLHVIVQVSSLVSRDATPDLQPHFTEEQRLLPSRAPPVFSS